MRFSNTDLKNMIVPLFGEQLLVLLVGIADTLIVSYTGEAAVSGVSLVNMVNTIFISLFTALASGGAVVISQYIGRKEPEQAGKAASQLLGQKNTILVVWMSQTFLNPISSVAPTAYIVWQNIANSYQIYHHDKVKKAYGKED